MDKYKIWLRQGCMLRRLRSVLYKRTCANMLGIWSGAGGGLPPSRSSLVLLFPWKSFSLGDSWLFGLACVSYSSIDEGSSFTVYANFLFFYFMYSHC